MVEEIKRIALLDSFKESICSKESVRAGQVDGYIIEVKANKNKGFNFGYLLYIPSTFKNGNPLIIEGANTGECSEPDQANREIYETSSRKVSQGASQHFISYFTNCPLMIPLIPRVWLNGKPIYTHALSSEALKQKNNDLERIDLQIINMIDDIKERFRNVGLELDKKVIMSGFSASAHFVQRFAILHSNEVMAVIAGGFNAAPTLSLKELNGKKLIYPVGIEDIDEYCEYDEKEYAEIKQYFYMGALDTNDSLPFNDAYKKEERELFYEILDKDISTRWEKAQKIYDMLGLNNITFHLYKGIGHTTNQVIAEDIVKFIDQVIIEKKKKIIKV